MADKESEPSAKADRPTTVEAVRAAVEQAFAATAGGAALTRERAQGIATDLGAAAGRVREALDELNLVERLEELRAEVDELKARVASLEGGAAAAPTASVGTKPAGTKAPGAGATGGAGAGAGAPDPTDPAPEASPGRS